MKLANAHIHIISIIILSLSIITPACTSHPENANSLALAYYLSGGDQGLTFDLTDAKALAVNQSSGSTAGSTPSESYGLVKILEDGTIQKAMHISNHESEGEYLPAIQFIAKAPNSKELYVSFVSNIHIHGHPFGNDDKNFGNFLHIRPNGSYRIIMDTNGVVVNNLWLNSEDAKAVVFDKDGNAYFCYRTINSGSDVLAIYKYTPADGKVVAITAPLEGYAYESFQIDPTGSRLFVKGSRTINGLKTNFLRMYPIADPSKPLNIYYSSNDSTWVRGYKISPDGTYLVLNGWNIRGINGIIKANIISDSEITYEPLYDSDMQRSFNPVYREEYHIIDNKTYFYGFFDKIEMKNLFILMTDKSSFYYADLSDLVESPGTTFVLVKQAGDTVTEKVFKELGVDVWFAANDENPAIFDTANYSWIEKIVSASAPLYKLKWWFYDSAGIHTLYKGIPADGSVANYYKDAAHYSNTIYCWNEHWYVNSDFNTKTLDTSEILKYLGSFYIEDYQFNFNQFINYEGIQESLNKEPYSPEDIFGTGSTADNWRFLTSHVMKPGTTSPATTFKKFRDDNNLGTWLDFQNISNLIFDSEGILWGVISSKWYDGTSSIPPKPVQLLDKDGKRALGVIDAFKSDTYRPVGFMIKDNYLYYKNATVDAGGFETGKHRLYRFKTNESSPHIDDLLQNLPEKDDVEILDYSIGDGYMYFTGIKGISVIGGRVNLSDFSYTPFTCKTLKARLTEIEVY